jgi:EmrB/QacA subfamily drug resistance transporter
MKEYNEAEKRITLWAVAIVFLLSALDQTVVSTAMPRIIAELHGLTLYSWVTTAYLLTSTVMVPIWGKLGDLFGRKPVLLAGITIFLAGSWLSGLSGEFGDMPILGGGMTQLIAFRALQGIGGGALFTTAFAIIADLYPPRERGKVGGMFGAVFGLSSTIGPLIGGYFTDHGTVTLLGHTVAGWRGVFYVNLPLSLISLFMVIVKMPSMTHKAKGKIDFIGAALIIGIAVPLLLALTFGGHSYPWTSPVVLGLFAGSAASLGLYIFAERFASDPILPLALFKNRVFWAGNLAGFLISMAFMSAAAYLPLFMQLGQGVPATASGLTMLPLMAGLMTSSIGCGRIVAKTGKYKPLILGGITISFIGIALLSRMDVTTTRLDLAWRMLILGIGLGPSQSLFNLAIQNALPREQTGVATSSSQFFRQIGSTMGVALFGTLLTGELAQRLGAVMPGMTLTKLQGMAAMAQTAGGGPALPDYAKVAVTSSITAVLTMGLVVVALAALCALLVPQIPLRAHPPTPKGDEPVVSPEAHL